MLHTMQITALSLKFSQKMQELILQLRNPPKGYLFPPRLITRYADFVTIASQLDFNYYYSEY